MLKRSVLLGLALLATQPATAIGKLYKCSNPKAATSIQSEPCPKGSKQIWVRDAEPEAPPTPQQQAALDAQRRRSAEDARALAQMAGTVPGQGGQVYYQTVGSSAAERAKARCQSARTHAQQVRDTQWRTLTYDRLQKLDDWVARECKGA